MMDFYNYGYGRGLGDCLAQPARLTNERTDSKKNVWNTQEYSGNASIAGSQSCSLSKTLLKIQGLNHIGIAIYNKGGLLVIFHKHTMFLVMMENWEWNHLN